MIPPEGREEGEGQGEEGKRGSPLPSHLSSLLTIIAMLSPKTWLSRGEPKQEANAISGFPARATTVSATQSATQFPSASTVRPSIAAQQQKQQQQGVIEQQQQQKLKKKKKNSRKKQATN